MPLFSIKHRHTDEALFELECDSLKLCLETAIGKGSSILTGADLAGASLRGASLARAGLKGANLTGADLTGADLRGASLASASLACASLASANLAGASLARANLMGASLASADLRGASLARADLAGADLTGADLTGADLAGASLRGASLASANLMGARLTGAKNFKSSIARTRILPDGDLIGWKKCEGGEIVKLRIPIDARRSHAFGRKCRAEFADVLTINDSADDSIVAVTSNHGPRTEYRVGARVACHEWDENWQIECSGGIHFFITRLEAEEWD